MLTWHHLPFYSQFGWWNARFFRFINIVQGDLSEYHLHFPQIVQSSTISSKYENLSDVGTRLDWWKVQRRSRAKQGGEWKPVAHRKRRCGGMDGKTAIDMSWLVPLPRMLPSPPGVFHFDQRSWTKPAFTNSILGRGTFSQFDVWSSCPCCFFGWTNQPWQGAEWPRSWRSNRLGVASKGLDQRWNSRYFGICIQIFESIFECSTKSQLLTSVWWVLFVTKKSLVSNSSLKENLVGS